MDTKMKQALPLIHKIESKYGSISHAPEDDPDFKKIRKIYPIVDKKDGRTMSQKLHSLIDRGYPCSYIASQLSISKAMIYDYADRNCLQFKRSFKYLLTSISGDIYYTTSLKYFLETFFNATNCSNMEARKYLSDHGFNVKSGNYVWHQVKPGSYFLLSYMDYPMLKVNKNSYVYPEEVV